MFEVQNKGGTALAPCCGAAVPRQDLQPESVEFSVNTPVLHVIGLE